MPIPPDLEAFKKNYLAVGLTSEQLKDLAGLAELKRYDARSTLIQAGQKSADMFVILVGSVRVQTPDGDKLADIGPGAVLGEISLLDSQPRSANALCMTSVEVAHFDANILRGYLNSHRDLGFVVLINLARVICGRLRDANSKIDILTDSAEAWKNAL
jgi:CRP-like cAMP-binding protein